MLFQEGSGLYFRGDLRIALGRVLDAIIIGRIQAGTHGSHGAGRVGNQVDQCAVARKTTLANECENVVFARDSPPP